MITLLIIIPLVGAIGVYATRLINGRAIALATNLVTLVVALLLWRSFDSTAGALQLVERHPWIPSIGAEYLLGADGLSLLLVLLTSVIFPFALLSGSPPRGLCSLMLVTQAALYGAFTAQNFVLWFLFYEMSLLPSFLLIRLWGGNNRDRAATKFFLYTFLGSVGMLLALLGIYMVSGTFDFPALAGNAKTGFFTGNFRWLAFFGVLIGLGVKVPLFPFHTWLPDAYETAPTGVTMMLTGILSKLGVYGFIRLFVPLFRNEIKTAAPWLLTLAACSIVFSSLAAWTQSDLKRMLAYLSINHLGYCLLGLFAVSALAAPPIDAQAALGGVFIQMFNHGITAAALFYWVGLLEQRRGGRGLNDFGGLMQRAPVLCGWMSVAIFSSLGLPGLNGFIGEFLIFKGAFGSATRFVAIAVLGLLFTAVVLLRTMHALFSGPVTGNSANLPDLQWREKFVIIPVTLLMFAIGLAPQFLFTVFNSTVTQLGRLLG